MKSAKVSSKKVILTFGTASSGKSTVLNALTQSKAFVPSKAAPELKSFAQTQKDGNSYIYIEVPDISQIVNSLQKAHDSTIKRLRELSATGVSAVLFCYPVTYVRCDSDTQKVLQFVKTFFKSKVPDVFLVFTFCSMLKGEELQKAKKGVAEEVRKLFVQSFNFPVRHVAFFNNSDKSCLLEVAKALKNLKISTKAVETWENLHKYIESERKESCEMLLQFADIMEEEKKLNEKMKEEIEDMPPDTGIIKPPNVTRAIRTKTSLVHPQKPRKELYLQLALSKERGRSEQKITRFSQPLKVLKKM